MSKHRNKRSGDSDGKSRAGRNADRRRTRRSIVELMTQIVKTFGRWLDDPDH